MNLPPQLEADLKVLRDQGLNANAFRNPSNPHQVFVVIEGYPLPAGWSKRETRLLLMTDVSYPNSKLDMFWVDPDLLLDGNRVPQAAEAIESHMNTGWRRFSWHVQKWNPAIDNIHTYLGTVDARLRQLQ